MAQLDITLYVYSDQSQTNQVAQIDLYPGSALKFELWECWHWAVANGFKVYNPAIYDPRFKEEFKDAGQIVSKNKLVFWLNEGYLSAKHRDKTDGSELLHNYPDNYVFKLIFADWS